MQENEFINIEEVKERFIGNYSLFSKFLFKFDQSSHFWDLKEKYLEKDAQGAFELAHALKGTSGNLSLKKIYNPLFDMVEVFRAGNLPSKEEWENLENAYNETIAYIEELKKTPDIKLF